MFYIVLHCLNNEYKIIPVKLLWLTNKPIINKVSDTMKIINLLLIIILVLFLLFTLKFTLFLNNKYIISLVFIFK